MRFLMFVLFLLPLLANAGQAKENLMYSSGRIYVVIAVILIILLGLILYLVRIEKSKKAGRRKH
ncbi:CcmD family protein [Niabella sp. W65]|nr:CcmD family protein [Niabella sp. W65]MCH7366635.1 CcmD family protein [Niabella sp. W65]